MSEQLPRDPSCVSWTPAEDLYLYLRALKRRCDKVSRVYDRLAQMGPLQFKIAGDKKQTCAETISPDSELSTSYAILMRPFLTETSPFYYRTAISRLKAEFPGLMPKAFYASCDSTASKISAGGPRFTYDGKDMNALDLYSLISEGGQFSNDSAARELLEGIQKTPVGPLAWFQFHSYNLDAYWFVDAIRSFVNRIERTEKHSLLRAAVLPESSQCIYCRSRDAAFNTEEHVIPEALGNEDLILPLGYVCDSCQNALSRLDQYLSDADPIAFLRTVYASVTKKGSLQSARFQNLAMRKTGPLHIRMEVKDKSANPRIEKLEDGSVLVHLQFRGRSRFRPIVLGRALYKIALSAAALHVGHRTVLDPRYDAARDFVLHGGSFRNNLAMSMEPRPHPGWRIHFGRDLGGTPVILDFYGCIFVLNLEETPQVEDRGLIPGLRFKCFPLDGSASEHGGE